MGYSHYFRTHKDGIPVSAWKKICADVRILLKNLPAHSTSAGGYHVDDSLVIQREADTPGKAPEITDSVIRFNGNSELGHETFYFERHPEMPDYQTRDGQDTVFSFCKTARKPYDLVVCGVLIIAAKHAARYLRVSSDGDLSEWMPAFNWVASVFDSGYLAPAIANRLLHGGSGELLLGGDTPETDTPVPEPEPITTSHKFIVDVRT